MGQKRLLNAQVEAAAGAKVQAAAAAVEALRVGREEAKAVDGEWEAGLRGKHLVTEVPLGRSTLPRVPAGMVGGLMEGGAARVTHVAPHFRNTGGTPHYLSGTAAQPVANPATDCDTRQALVLHALLGVALEAC